MSTTRREFVAGILGVAAGAGAFEALAARAKKEGGKGKGGKKKKAEAGGAAVKGEAGKIQLGLATYTWGMDWDIPTMIANMTKAKVYGVELRTQSKYKHGVEIDATPAQRAEVKKQFADSPVAVVSVACSERMDWPDAAKLKAAIEAAKGYLKLSADIGSKSLRVFPNQFNEGVPHEQTIAQIAKAVNELGAYAADLGQRVDLEAHGPAGDLATMKAVMEQVTSPVVGIRLNCDKRDVEGAGLAANIGMMRGKMAQTIHLHNLKDANYPYQEFVNIIVKMGWSGWALMENSDKVEDRVAAIIEQREIWEAMMAKAKQA